MYCGSCLRDSALAMALRRAGHDVVMVPLYTPVRDEGDGSDAVPVFYGGLNVYLQHATRFFRRTPRVVDWLLDRPWLLRLAGSLGAQTAPAKLGELTLSVLHGEQGPAVKELRRLCRFLRDHHRSQVVSLPNLMFIGAARLLREETGAPIVCELTGEDIFLDALAEPQRSEAQRLIRQRCGDVAAFVATSAYYADAMARYLDVPPQRIHVVYPGVPADYCRGATYALADRPPTVGYLARICPEKGLDRLLDAMALLVKMPGMADAVLRVGGYLGARDRAWFKAQRLRLRSLGLGKSVVFHGEVDRAGKLSLLDSVDVLSVPTAHPEPKGLYVLEAWARGVPVVLPAHGSFPELVEWTGGGVLTSPGDARQLAEALHGLLSDPARRQQLGDAGAAAVRERFTDAHMAANMLRIYEGLLQ
mgnify:CR=1 FL=1